MNYEDRIVLEKSIIAELLYDPNAFIKVAGYLSSKNFAEPLYKKLYSACESLYPNTVIEPFTVAEKSGIAVFTILTESTDLILQHKNIKYRALILVELSIKDQFVKLISVIQESTYEYGSDQWIAFSEIIEYSREESMDVFLSIENTLSFMSSKKELYEEELQQLKEFNENIVKKCKHIRSSLHIRDLYYNLENLYQFDYKKKELLQALSNITRYVMAHDVEPAIASQILTLSNI